MSSQRTARAAVLRALARVLHASANSCDNSGCLTISRSRHRTPPRGREPALFPISQRCHGGLNALSEGRLGQAGLLPRLAHQDLLWRRYPPKTRLRLQQRLTQIRQGFAGIGLNGRCHLLNVNVHFLHGHAPLPF